MTARDGKLACASAAALGLANQGKGSAPSRAPFQRALVLALSVSCDLSHLSPVNDPV